MKPRLLNLAAGFSLLLAIAIVALWVRSYWRRAEIVYVSQTSTERRTWDAESRYGVLHLEITYIPDPSRPFAPIYYYLEDRLAVSIAPSAWFPFPPARFSRNHPAGSYDQTAIGIAYWLLLLPTLPLPLLALVRHRRRRRRETNNLCPTCGYDLRATPDRCPECGAVPASSAVS